MRRMLLVALPIVAAVMVGCGGESEISSLKGTWIGTGTGFDGSSYQEVTAKMVITEVREDSDTFLGQKQTKEKGGTYGPKTTIRGAIGADGVISITDDDGYAFFEFSEDTLEGQYLEANPKAGTAKNYTFERQ
ncbi:MAG: hypothetical protein ACKOGM_04960 [Solirubrobacterales bacterium]